MGSSWHTQSGLAVLDGRYVNVTGDTMTGALLVGLAGNALILTNSNDSTPVQVAILQGDRATMADGDEAYLSLKLSDDAGNQAEYARIRWTASDVNVGTGLDGIIKFSIMTGGTLTGQLQLAPGLLSPLTNDTVALGSTALMWSDLFLASGGIVNFNNGDITLTHSTDTLTLSGGVLVIGDDHFLNPNGSAIFNETGADADFRIESDGNVNMFFVDASTNRIGIGTNAPEEILHLETGDYTTMRFDAASDEGFFYADGVFHFVVMGSRTSTPVRVVYGGTQRLDFSATENVFNDNAADIDTRIEGDTQANLFFADASTDRIGIGTNAPSAQVHTTGTFRMANFGAGAATFDANGNISSASDERLKIIEGDFTRGLKDIENIRPITYKWNKKSGLETRHSYTGFSAQNVQKSIPEAVGIDPKGYLTFNDRPVLAALLNSINELVARIEVLEERISHHGNI